MNLPPWNVLIQENWKLNERFDGQEQLGALTVNYTAVSFVGDENIELTAVGLGDKHQAEWKAFGECLERVVAFKAYFNKIDWVSDFRPALTNGIAAFPQKEECEQRAKRELIERDAIIKSWNGIIESPLEISTSLTAESFGLADDYELKVYRIAKVAVKNETFFVTGSFLIPRGSNRPLVYGFACSSDEKAAIDHAIAETSQRYIFLKDETDFNGEIKYSPTAAYHQDFFLKTENHRYIHNWIYQKSQPTNPEYRIETNFEFEILRSEPLFVIKAKNDSCMPLYFGRFKYPKGAHYASNCELHPIP